MLLYPSEFFLFQDKSRSCLTLIKYFNVGGGQFGNFEIVKQQRPKGAVDCRPIRESFDKGNCFLHEKVKKKYYYLQVKVFYFFNFIIAVLSYFSSFHRIYYLQINFNYYFLILLLLSFHIRISSFQSHYTLNKFQFMHNKPNLMMRCHYPFSSLVCVTKSCITTPIFIAMSSQN